METDEVNRYVNAKASITTFKRVFNDNFKNNARFMRCKGNHTSCEICINASLLLTDSGRNWPPAADDIIKAWRHLHLVQQHRERVDADVREERARTEFDKRTGNPKYFFMCADFVSNSVGDTPRTNIQGRHSTSEQTRKKIQSRMCGVHAICGNIDEFFIFYTDNMTPGGTNTMIQIFRLAIEKLTMKLAKQVFKLPKMFSFKWITVHPRTKTRL
jgi:hypothetical protein